MFAFTLSALSLWDYAAVAFFVAAWSAIGWRIEHPSHAHPSVSVTVERYRHDWMRHMVTRQPRIFDSAVLATLREGTSFFASASMIAIGGGFALMADPSRLVGLAEDLTRDDAAPEMVWEVRLALALLLLANAFLKFVWSHRLFGYCAVVMASTPNDPEDPIAYVRAEKAAEINISAARSFNRGLRAVYFAMAALAWLAGPLALALATAVTLYVLWQREFSSRSRSVLLGPDMPDHSSSSGS